MNFSIEQELKLSDEIFDARYHSKKANLICVTTISGDVHLLEDGRSAVKLRKHHKGSPIRRVRFDKDGHMITIAKTVKIHDIEANQLIQSLKRNDEEKTMFYSVMPLGGSIICAGDDNGKVLMWDTRAPDMPVFSAKDCEQYISGIDGKYEGRRMFVCTSGEGTLTAYDIRANKMIEPQSELFEAGFQCVKIADVNRKVVIGGEDGAVYVFNHGEWAHTSGKFALSDDTQNRGKCSIEGIDAIPNTSKFLTACSDGRLRSVSLWPHNILGEKIVCKGSSLDTIHVNPHHGKSEVIVGGDKYINIITFQENDESDSEKDFAVETNEDDNSGKKNNETPHVSNPDAKRIKVDKEDYLNIFQ